MLRDERNTWYRLLNARRLVVIKLISSHFELDLWKHIRYKLINKWCVYFSLLIVPGFQRDTKFVFYKKYIRAVIQEKWPCELEKHTDIEQWLWELLSYYGLKAYWYSSDWIKEPEWSCGAIINRPSALLTIQCNMIRPSILISIDFSSKRNWTVDNWSWVMFQLKNK
jgi:hypothetical protein